MSTPDCGVDNSSSSGIPLVQEWAGNQDCSLTSTQEMANHLVEEFRTMQIN
jgi:hypothetical protein